MVEVGYARSIPRTGGRVRPGRARRPAGAAAREPEVTTVRASVRPDNIASTALVDSCGFVAVGQQWDEEDGLKTVYERPA